MRNFFCNLVSIMFILLGLVLGLMPITVEDYGIFAGFLLLSGSLGVLTQIYIYNVKK